MEQVRVPYIMDIIYIYYTNRTIKRKWPLLHLIKTGNRHAAVAFKENFLKYLP